MTNHGQISTPYIYFIMINNIDEGILRLLYSQTLKYEQNFQSTMRSSA